MWPGESYVVPPVRTTKIPAAAATRYLPPEATSKAKRYLGCSEHVAEGAALRGGADDVFHFVWFVLTISDLCQPRTRSQRRTISHSWVKIFKGGPSLVDVLNHWVNTVEWKLLIKHIRNYRIDA